MSTAEALSWMNGTTSSTASETWSTISGAYQLHTPRLAPSLITSTRTNLTASAALGGTCLANTPSINIGIICKSNCEAW